MCTLFCTAGGRAPKHPPADFFRSDISLVLCGGICSPNVFRHIPTPRGVLGHVHAPLHCRGGTPPPHSAILLYSGAPPVLRCGKRSARSYERSPPLPAPLRALGDIPQHVPPAGFRAFRYFPHISISFASFDFILIIHIRLYVSYLSRHLP